MLIALVGTLLAPNKGPFNQFSILTDRGPVLRAQSVWACVLIALVGFLLALNKERFPKLEVGFSIALLTYPIVAIPGKPIHPFPLMHYWMKLCRWLIMQAAFTALLIQPC